MNELISKAKLHDQSAREIILDSYKILVKSIANKLTWDGYDKEDLLMEGFLGVLNAIDYYDETKGAFPSFVKVCVLSKMLSAFKGVQRANDKQKNNVDIDDSSEIVESLALFDPLAITEYNLLVEKINEIMQTQMTVIEKEICSLFLDGLSYNEITAQTGKSRKSVDGALQRAKKKLKEHLKDYR